MRRWSRQKREKARRSATRRRACPPPLMLVLPSLHALLAQAIPPPGARTKSPRIAALLTPGAGALVALASAPGVPRDDARVLCALAAEVWTQTGTGEDADADADKEGDALAESQVCALCPCVRVDANRLYSLGGCSCAPCRTTARHRSCCLRLRGRRKRTGKICGCGCVCMCLLHAGSLTMTGPRAGEAPYTGNCTTPGEAGTESTSRNRSEEEVGIRHP
jgi:hypothetical protein